MDPLKIAINSRTSGKFNTVTINNRPHLVTTMVPIVGNTAMNRIHYPEAEVSKSFMQLNMLPAPAGHPQVNGVDVPAFHPLATNAHNIGGLIRKPRRNGLKVECEFCLDTEVAQATENGRETMRRIQNGESVGVSTGLTIAQITNKTGKDDFGGEFDVEGAGFKFDHVAILLNEEAAGKHAGTELVVNAQGEAETVFIADIKPKAMETVPENGLGISTDQLHTLLSQLIRAEANIQHGEDDIFAWVRDTFPESKLFIYSVEVEGMRRLFKRSYVIDAAGKVSLGADAVPVVEKTTFVPEARATNQKETDMEKELFVLSLIANSGGKYTGADKDRLMAMSDSDLAAAPFSPVTNDQARKILIDSGMDLAGFEDYVTNKDKFDAYLADAETRMGEMREEIVANSTYEATDLEGMSEAQLLKVNANLKPKAVDRLAPGGGQIINSAQEGDAVVDYS